MRGIVAIAGPGGGATAAADALAAPGGAGHAVAAAGGSSRAVPVPSFAVVQPTSR